jgi:hypothetical protein
MKNLALILFILIPITAFSKSPAKFIPKAIYGRDDRMDVYESSDNLMRELSRSTAAKITNNNLSTSASGYSLSAQTLKQTGKCETERFSNQLVAAQCSGFLVGKDLLLTAAHCIHSVVACNSHSWVFDYANSEEERTSFNFNRDQVYRCTEIIERVYDTATKADYALLRLDRPVVGRSPLKYRVAGRPSDDALMTVIGNPLGLPIKITVGADMRDNSNPVYFVTNSDTFNLNSGSAVLDSRTGIVEGILVRGGRDFMTGVNQCQSSIVYGQNDGRGEDVVRITIVKSLMR